MNDGKLVDRALMAYVVIEKRLIGRQRCTVHVFRGKAAGISDHFLVEAKLDVAKGWKSKRGEAKER